MLRFQRPLCFVIPVIFGLATTHVAPSAAQTAPDSAEVPACKTTAGDDGLMFLGEFGLVYAPVAFDRVSSDANKLYLLPELRDAQGVLALGGPGSSDLVKKAGTLWNSPVEALVEFNGADGGLVHQCTVTIVAFDPSIHDLSQLQTGDCNLRLLSGRPQLLAGHDQVWETPQDYDELSMTSPWVADFAHLSGNKIYLLGKSPGVTALTWTAMRADGGTAINICPVPVLDPKDVLGPDGPKDEDLCKDVTGAIIRLSVGETAMVAMRDRDGLALPVDSGAVAADHIADMSFGEGRTDLSVTGVAPGSTSISLFDANDAVLHHCEIVVE